MDMHADGLKRMASELGADLAGIAPVERFEKSPKGHHPRDLLPGCKSVISLACAFPESALRASHEEYTAIRNALAQKLDDISEALAARIAAFGAEAVAIKTLAAALDGERFMGPISLKHAGMHAGLGMIGKNTLLTNDRFGNMIWVGAVVTSLALEPDPLAAYSPCREGCTLCVDACPARALGEDAMNQLACYSHAFHTVDGVLKISCWECRTVCPSAIGARGATA